MAAIPLADCGGDVTLVVVDVVLPSQGQLPADLRLEGERIDAAPQRRDVEGATWSRWEPGPVEEDAGLVHDPGDRLTVLVLVDDVLLHAVVLPLFGRERGSVL